MPLSPDPSLALRLQRDRLREYLPHLWEGFNQGRMELLEVELKRFFTAIRDLHEFLREKECRAHALNLESRTKWDALEESLIRGLPALYLTLSGPILELESAFMSEPDPELRARLAFCLGGLKRFQSVPLPPSHPIPVTEGFPGYSRGSEAEAVARIVTELKQKSGAPHSPAELLGRIEIACAGRWYAHFEQIKYLREVANGAALHADEARKKVVDLVTQRFFPVLDTMESMLPQVKNSGPERTWFKSLRSAGSLLLEYLAARDIVTLDVQSGEPFNPEWHSCGWVGHSLKPAPRTVTQMLRRGYRVKSVVVRPAEVETVLA